jgi:hypothetical protein
MVIDVAALGMTQMSRAVGAEREPRKQAASESADGGYDFESIRVDHINRLLCKLTRRDATGTGAKMRRGISRENVPARRGNPYCYFRSDIERRRALRSRDVRIVLVCLLVALASEATERPIAALLVERIIGAAAR